MLFLHPAVLLVGVQLPGKADALQAIHERVREDLHQHLSAGGQQALQGRPDGIAL